MCKFSERIVKNNNLIYNIVYQEDIMDKLEQKLQQLKSIFSSKELNLARQIIIQKIGEYNNLDDDIFQTVIKTMWELKENNQPLRKDTIITKVTNDLSWAKTDLESLESNKENPEYIIDEINKSDLFAILEEELKFNYNSSDEILKRNVNIIIDKLSGVSIKKLSEQYSISEKNITTIVRQNIHRIKLRCLRAYLTDMDNYKEIQDMLHNYYNEEYEEPKNWRHCSATEKNMEDWASALSYRGKCMEQDEKTYESICGLAKYVYQKKLPQKIS